MNSKAILTTCIAILMTACASVKDASLKIGPGDSKELVATAMGTPEDRQFQGALEAWQYSNIATIGVCEYTTFWFKDGKVNGVSTYRNGSIGGCRAGMRSIRWEDAPDTIVEIRRR